MLTLLNSQKQSSQSFVADFQLDKASFDAIANKVLMSALANVEVPGFRKGKAPHDLAMKKIDQQMVQSNVINDAVFGNYDEAEKLMREVTDKEKLEIMNIGVSTDPQYIITGDNGFSFRLISNLLPNFDFELLEKTVKSTKITTPKIGLSYEQVEQKELEMLVSNFNVFEPSDAAACDKYMVTLDINETDAVGTAREFADQKHLVDYANTNIDLQGMINQKTKGIKKDDVVEFEFDLDGTGPKSKLKLTCLAVEKPKFTTAEQIFANNERVSSALESLEKYKETIAKRYNQALEQDQKTTDIQAINVFLVSNSPDIETDAEIVESETTRIITELRTNEKDPVAAFNIMKLAHTKPATDKTLEQEIQNYVSGEVKLGLILSAIYIKKVENKLSEAETEEMLKTISANPEQYGYPKGLTNDQLRNTLIDNAMRNTAINYIADNMMVEF